MSEGVNSEAYKLKGFDSVFDTTQNNTIQDNLVEFFSWALLEKGNYFNVTKGEQDHNGTDMSVLRISGNEHYASGQAWEGFRKNWVWQSGVTPPSGMTAPLVGTNNAKPGVSGVYVDNTFYPNDTTGTYAHSIDHYNGRIIFDNAIPTTSNVQAEYSYRYISTVYSANLPFLREIQYRTLGVPNGFSNDSKGEFEVPPEMRVQLPAIAVELVPRRTFKGYRLGGGQYIYQDVLIHCLAETSFERNRLLDIVSMQNDKTLQMFDNNAIAASGAFPLDYRGVPNSGALDYPHLTESYKYSYMYLTNAVVQGMELINSNFSAGIVRFTTETVGTNL